MRWTAKPLGAMLIADKPSLSSPLNCTIDGGLQSMIRNMALNFVIKWNYGFVERRVGRRSQWQWSGNFSISGHRVPRPPLSAHHTNISSASQCFLYQLPLPSGNSFLLSDFVFPDQDFLFSHFHFSSPQVWLIRGEDGEVSIFGRKWNFLMRWQSKGRGKIEHPPK